VNTEKTRARRARAPGRLTAGEWEAKRALFQGRCAYCARPSQSLEMDHVVPLACGGAHDVDNVVPACRPCNRSKGGKLVADWREDRRRRGEMLPLDPHATLGAIPSAELRSTLTRVLDPTRSRPT
jgi:5-methylcytosine-specific restriction endonuclease McrA